jgi:hypothetical protein
MSSIVTALCLTSAACTDAPDDCTADVVEIDGETYARDPEHDCQFVDADGDVLHPQP